MAEIKIFGLDNQEFDPNEINGYTLEQLRSYHQVMLDTFLGETSNPDDVLPHEHPYSAYFGLINTRIVALEFNLDLKPTIDIIESRLKFFKARGLFNLLKEIYEKIEPNIHMLQPEVKDKLVKKLKALPSDPIYDAKKNSILALLGELEG